MVLSVSPPHPPLTPRLTTTAPPQNSADRRPSTPADVNGTVPLMPAGSAAPADPKTPAQTVCEDGLPLTPADVSRVRLSWRGQLLLWLAFWRAVATLVLGICVTGNPLVDRGVPAGSCHPHLWRSLLSLLAIFWRGQLSLSVAFWRAAATLVLGVYVVGNPIVGRGVPAGGCHPRLWHGMLSLLAVFWCRPAWRAGEGCR